MNHSIKESLKYCLRSYPLIHSYVREIEGLYAMGTAELKKRNEQRFLDITGIGGDQFRDPAAPAEKTQ